MQFHEKCLFGNCISIHLFFQDPHCFFYHFFLIWTCSIREKAVTISKHSFLKWQRLCVGRYEKYAFISIHIFLHLTRFILLRSEQYVFSNLCPNTWEFIHSRTHIQISFYFSFPLFPAGTKRIGNLP